MSLRTDKVQLEIIIKGDKTRQELSQLETKSKQLARELKRLPEGSDEFIRKSAELKTVKNRMDELRNSIGLTGMTVRELAQRKKELGLILRNIDPRTPKYKELRAELDKVNVRMKELNGQAASTGFSLNKLAGGFNKYFSMFAAFAASALGMVLSMRKMVDEFSKFDAALKNLSALTGLTGQQLDWLGEQAKILSTSIIEGNIRITSSADEILDAYTKVGSKMPELLSDQEALNEVTKQALILAQAGNIDLDVSVTALTNTMNQFNATAEEAGRYINAIAAGAKYGAADIDYVGTAIVKFGAAANALNIEVTESIALIEVLGKAGLSAEEAGTGLKTFLLQSAKAADEFNVEVVGLEAVLNNLAAANLSAAEMQKLFGNRGYVVAQSLVNNLPVYDDLIGKIDGTNTAYEMAAINSDTHAAKMEQARNKAKLLSIELGQKLAPVMIFSTNAARKFLITLMNLPKIIKENRFLVLALGTALIVYYQAQIKATGAAIAQYLWGQKSIVQIFRNIIAQAALTKSTIMHTAATQGCSIATAALRVAMNALKAAMATNPIGLIAVAAATAVAVIWSLAQKTEELSESQKKLQDEIRSSIEPLQKQQVEFNELIHKIKMVNEGTETRKKLIEELNQKYPKFLENLDKENLNNAELEQLLKKVNAHYREKIRLVAMEKIAQDKMRQAVDYRILIDDPVFGFQAKLDQAAMAAGASKITYQGETSWVFSGIGDEAAVRNFNNALNMLEQAEAEYDKLVQGYADVIEKSNELKNMLDFDDDESSGSSSIASSTEKETKKLITQYQHLEEQLKKLNELFILQSDLGLYSSAAETAKRIENIKAEMNYIELRRKAFEMMAEGHDPMDFTKLVLDDMSYNSAKLKSYSDLYKKQAELDKKRYDDYLKMLDDMLKNEKIKYSERKDALMKAHEDEMLTEEDFQIRLLALKKQYWEKASDLANEITHKIGLQTTSIIETYQHSQFTREMTRIKTKYNEEYLMLERLYERKAISEDEFNARKISLEKKFNEEQRKLKIEQAKREADVKNMNILMQSAESVFKITSQIAEYIAEKDYVGAALAGVQLGLVIAGTVVQIDAVNAARDAAIAEFATGRYPLMGKSGKVHNVSYGGEPKTGFVSTPTHFIAGEAGPEMIIDYPTLRNISMNRPELLSMIYQMRVNEHASGSYPQFTQPDSSAATGINNQLLMDIYASLRQIEKNTANTYSFKDLYDKLLEIEKQYDQINDNYRG